MTGATKNQRAIRALHVIPGVSRRYGGPSRAVYDMCSALQQRGGEPVVCTTDADGEARLPVELGRVGHYRGVPTIFFARQWSEAYKYSRPLARWLKDNVKHFDVVHIHAVFSHSSLAAARVCRKSGVPYVVRPLGSLSPTSMGQKRIRKRVWWLLGVRRMLASAAVIHYTSVGEQNAAEGVLGLRNGVVIPLGVSEDILRECLSEDEASVGGRGGANPYVFVLSRLHPIKGLEAFLKCFLKVTDEDKYRHWRLKIAGDGEADYVSTLKKIVREAGERNSVSFLGWLEGREKIEFLKHASLLAMPSHHENFGLSLVEALACGVPALVSDHVSLAAEIERSGGVWVTELNREKLTATLREALSCEEELKRRGKAGRDFIRRQFSWPKQARRLDDLYRSITGNAAFADFTAHPDDID